MKINKKKQLAGKICAGNPPIRTPSLAVCLSKTALHLAILTVLYPSPSYANPNGAQIVNGQVSIDTATPGVTTVTNSPDAIINWQNFSIAQNELTQFIQQNGQSAVLNRIIGQNPSEILGQLASNGKVFLINPNGIVFGAGSVIDTQGLIASSLNLSDQDFLSGNYHFMAGSSAGNILNEGIIRAGKDGNVILIAPQIENNGIIKSDGGSITLAAGQELTITNLDSPDIRFQIQAPADSVLNLGKLLTEGGAINVFASTIKHSGEISADSVQIDKQGHIQLVAQQDITLAAGSRISANNSLGDAGTIHIDSKTGTTLAQGTIEAQAIQSGSSTQLTTGKGGKIELLGEQVGVLDQAHIDASGENGGGEVLIGGDHQGKNAEIHHANATYIGKDTFIKADAKTHGDGGKVIVWSDDDTRIHGNLSAQGGSQSGNGGFIETSGAHVEIADTARVSTLAYNGNSGTWLIDPLDFTISAGSDTSTISGIGATTLSTMLNSTSVTIVTDASTAGNGDIFVNSAVSWGAHLLTLSAHRNININADLNGSGTAQLALKYGQGAGMDGNLSSYSLNNGAQINLSAGANFSTKLGSNGVVTNYTVITSLGEAGSTSGTDLQGMKGNLAGKYVLGANINATATSSWNNGGGTPEGFMPVGFTFTGQFDGLGHTISNLTINRPSTDYVGLFSYVDTATTIKNVGLINASVTGRNTVGGLVGWNSGTVSNSYASGSVNGNQNVGGLVGSNPGGTIGNSYATANVTGTANDVGGLTGWSSGTVSNSYATGVISGLYYIGGLVGYDWAGSAISNSYATGNVNGINYIGGLVGYNDNDTNIISNSYATGIVTGSSYAGGLIGWNSGTVSNSYAIGNVSGTANNVGGLIGRNSGAINNSYATGIVNGNNYVGGLIGYNDYGSVNNSYSTGTVTGNNKVGGLIGYNYGGYVDSSYSTGGIDGNNYVGGLVGYNSDDDGGSGGYLTNSYAIGAVTGHVYVGGLVGNNRSGNIENTYATGDVSGINHIGGLVGSNSTNNSTINNSYATGLATATDGWAGGLVGSNNGSVTSSFWDNTGGLTGIGTDDGIVTDVRGLNTAEMHQMTNFTSAGWDIANTGGTSAVWRIYEGSTAPLLRSFLTSLTVTADNVTKIYNRSIVTSLTNASYSVAEAATGSAHIPNIANPYNGAANVGSYAPGLYSDQQGYDISYIGANLTITPALLNLSVTADNATRVYGDANPVFTGNITAGGLANGDTLNSIGLSYTTLATPFSNVGIYAITPKITSSNYTFTSIDGQLTVSPLASVAWIGGNGNWSTAGNWANNILPTTGNVLAATIPTSVTVTYDSSAGNTYLNSLSSLGHFQMTGGSLGISGNFSTAQYTQSGGSLSAGNFKVTNAFNQTGGLLTANNVFINAINTIAQGALGNINATNLTANSGGDVSLAGVNFITGVLDISAGGNIYSRTQGVSRMNSLIAPNGWIDVENIGGFILGSTALNQGTTVANAAGNIVIKAKSPLTVNGAVASSGGSVSLTASNGDILSINAPISAPNGVTLAGGTLTGSNAGSYLQYFNNATSSENILTNSTEQVTQAVVGTTQLGQPSADQSGSYKNSIDASADSIEGKGKNAKQCTK